jgi:hypothetical protein
MWSHQNSGERASSRPGAAVAGGRGRASHDAPHRAIATAKGVDPDQLADQLQLSFRVPRLAAPGAGGELAAIYAELAAHPRPWSSWTRCIWLRLGPVARTCTTWAPSSKPSKASASTPVVRCWW